MTAIFKFPIDILLYLITSILGVFIGGYKIMKDNDIEYKGMKATDGFKDTMKGMQEMESSFKDAYRETYEYVQPEQNQPTPKPRPKPRPKPGPKPRKTQAS